ncbi:WD repeat-containing protein 6 [Oleoguttula sp. CCFEE 5521]
MPEAVLDQAVDTGFGATEQSNENAPPLIAAALGHVSRIWSVRTFVSNDRFTIWTFGEDATRIEWHLEHHTESSQCQLVQDRVDTCHTGKNIWSTARTILLEDTCATGGADGSIAILPDDELHGSVRSTVTLFSQLHASRERPLDATKSYAFVAQDALIAVSNQGHITLVTLLPNGEFSTESLAYHEELRTYSLATGFAGTAIVAGKGGTVYMFDTAVKELSIVANAPGKVAGLFMSIIRTADDATRPRLLALVTTLGSSNAQLVEVSASELIDNTSATARRNCRQLQLTQDFVVTSFVMVNRGVDGIAVLGSRSGAIAVYDLSSQRPGGLHPCFDRAGVHGDAITTLGLAPPKDTSESRYLFASSRDGTYSAHLVTFGIEGLSFDLVHKLSISFGPNIEGLRITQAGHLQVWGFRSKHFILHDVTSQEDVMKVECSGVHSSWAFLSTDEGGTFAWTQAGKIVWTTQTQQPVQRINAGGHGREIKACAVSPGSPQLVATGAEDTDIKLFTYDKTRGFRCLQTLRKHVTGIQHLQWSPDGTWLFSSGGFEEFYVWKITRDVPYVNVGVVCTARYPRNGKSDLRIMGLDVQEVQPEGHHGTIEFHITMAYSDSTLKTWSFNSSSPDPWTLMVQGSYLTSCLSSVYILEPAGPNATALTTSTDGHVNLWSSDSTDAARVSWTSRHQVHQNAVLSCTVHTLPDRSTLIITGGDDNALAFTRITDYPLASPSLRTLIIPRAHAAAVTGVLCRSTGVDGALEVVSVGLDQKVKVWQVRIDTSQDGVDGVEVQRKGKGWSSVADAGEMVWLGGRGRAPGQGVHNQQAEVLVVGVGMEVWSLDGDDGPNTIKEALDSKS